MECDSLEAVTAAIGPEVDSDIQKKVGSTTVAGSDSEGWQNLQTSRYSACDATSGSNTVPRTKQISILSLVNDVRKATGLLLGSDVVKAERQWKVHEVGDARSESGVESGSW